jgi:hypothetical protein
MTRLRFETARDLLEAFPEAGEYLRIEFTDEPPLQFLNGLAERSPDAAIGFCAYMLPRREAVWWACQSARALDPPETPEEQQSLMAAEQWVKDPEEGLRIAALKTGQAANYRHAATWLALAAGWAGNTMPFDDKSVPVPPDQTAKATRAAILIAAAKCDPKQRADLLRNCIEQGARLAAGAGESA